MAKVVKRIIECTLTWNRCAKKECYALEQGNNTKGIGKLLYA